MADVGELQQQLNSVKSEIEDIQMQLKTAGENDTGIKEKLDTLKDRQMQLTQEIEEITGLSGVMGDVRKG